MVRFQVCRIQRSSGTFLTVSKADGGERPEEVKLPAAAHRYATEGGICDSKWMPLELIRSTNRVEFAVEAADTPRRCCPTVPDSGDTNLPNTYHLRMNPLFPTTTTSAMMVMVVAMRMMNDMPLLIGILGTQHVKCMLNTSDETATLDLEDCLVVPHSFLTCYRNTPCILACLLDAWMDG
ncbi:hypothetical protein EGR_00724 [Echinococcus granulosus]|uniref:Uncharacterized protein n=1 Tax=Echinococcus granulosus TaxID=6210 RepID=W6UR38_ECHGR|nr:hypothetical protein EGR_00724 [Echinococcus granulosus]EUB64180.1 hypothetical protein EGR_00724 [Echinococcus granulosus]